MFGHKQLDMMILTINVHWTSFDPKEGHLAYPLKHECESLSDIFPFEMN